MPGWLKTGLCRVLAVPSIHCVPVVPQFALIHNEDSVHHIDGEESVAAQNRRAFLEQAHETVRRTQRFRLDIMHSEAHPE